ncbi:hypothetical protein Q3G72_029853 [Acer saccharum]|nr:hypothetical protein Q3G72_024168 [Acer saccharum]KAK1589035.1 hypothetical protein Q3G72_029853 [Acer saccharum]
MNSWPTQRTINIHCKFSECNVIENVLRSTESEYELLQGSCLRHLLQVPNDHMFSGQLVHTLLVREIKMKVTPWLFSLVDNEEEFNAFPWGHYVFKLTFYRLRKCLGHSNYYGFPYALQIWAMEAIMSMRKMLADPLVDLGNEVQMPRLLKWSFKKRPKNFLTELKTLEDVGQFTAKEVLVPTPWEEGQAYWVGIDTDLSEGPRFVPPILGNEDKGVVDLGVV